jgi:hypothetical protein
MDVAAGNPIQQEPIIRGKPHAAPRAMRERLDSAHVKMVAAQKDWSFVMRNRLHLPATLAMCLIGVTTSAFAQGAAGGAALGTAPGVGTNPPVGTQHPGSAGITSAPGGSSTTTTGMGTRSTVNPTHNQPGVPDTSTPGRFGTGASPSGLPGDDPAHPGFPGKVGR